MSDLSVRAPARRRAAAEVLPLLLARVRFPGWALAYAACFAPALIVAWGQPAWSRVDEAQHADYVAQLAHGTYPVEGRTTIEQSTLDLMVRSGVFRWNLPGRQPEPAARLAADLTPVPAGLGAYARNLWIRRHLWSLSYEAAQPPLFYLLAAPAWLAGFHAGGALGAVHAVRLLNALLLGLLGPIALGLAGLMFPARKAVRWGSVALVAVTPGLLLNGTQVSNDTLATVLGALVVLAALRGARQGWDIGSAALAGALFGLALLAKLTTVGLVVPLAAALALPWLSRRRPFWQQAGLSAVAAGVAISLVTPWVIANLHLYGEPVPARAAAALLGQVFPPRPLSPGYVKDSLLHAFSTFWSGEPHDVVPLHRLVTYSMGLCAPVVAFGLWRTVRRREPGRDRLALGLLAGGGVLAWTVATLQVSGVGGDLPGRYLYPALAPTLVAWVGGLFAAVPWAAARVGGLALFAAFSFVNVGGYLAGFTGFPVAAHGSPGPAAQRLPASAAGSFGGLQVDVDQVALDGSARAVWVHLSASNESGAPIDWWPVVYLEVPGRGRVSGDYGASTPFPETLAAGQTVSGWSRVDVDPAAAGGPLRAELLDVAADGYREVGVIRLAIEAAGLPAPEAG